VSTSAAEPASAATARTGPPPGRVGDERLASRIAPGQIALLITILGGILRFATLNVQSIWLDESATMILVRRSFGGMLSHLSSSESAPPLYYVVAWVWTRIFGTGPLGFRSLSALVGTLTIPVMYAAGRRISPRAGIWAALLCACSPALYYYSQEARNYGMLVFFCAVAFVLFQRAQESPTARNLWMWGIASAVALLTHYFAVFLFLPEAWLLLRRHGVHRTWRPTTLVVLVGAALAPLALAEREGGKTSWIEAESLPSRLAESVKQFAVGPYGPLEIPAAAVVLALAGLALLALWRKGGREERSAAWTVAFVAAVAVLVPLLLAAVKAIDVYDGRNVIATLVPLIVLIAAGLGASASPRLGTLLGACICAVSLAVVAGIDLTPSYQRDDWRGIAQALPGPPAGGRVIVGEQFASLPLYVYLGSLNGSVGQTVTTREIDFVALRQRRSARSPLPAKVPTAAPPGFAPAGVVRTSAYAVARFTSSRPATVSVQALRREQGEAKAEVVRQR
jgi:mannosyltransferase